MTVALWLVDYFHKQLTDNSILEVVDAESVDDFMAARPGTSTKWNLLLGLVPLPALCVSPRAFVMSSVCLGSAAIGGIAIEYVQLRKFIRLSLDLENSIRKLFHSLRERQVAAFGIGLSGSEIFPSTRRHVLLLLRSLASAFVEGSKRLVAESSNESAHLLSNFFTVEMNSLLEGDEDLNRNLSTANSLKTLWELCILLRSEFSRLSLLSLNEHSVRTVRTLWVANSKMASLISSFRDTHKSLQSALSSRSAHGLKNSLETSKESTNLHKVTVQLEVVLEGLHSNRLNESDLARSLRVILSSLNGLGQPASDLLIEKNTDEEERDVSQEPHFVPSPIPTAEPVDQVFEAVAHNQQAVRERINWEDDLLDKSTSLNILGELRNAIQGRAKMFEERELRALAAFHGVNVEELLERLEKEENLKDQSRYGSSDSEPETELPSYHPRGKEVESGEFTGDGEYSDSENFSAEPSKCAPPSLGMELMMALKARNPQETMIGDSDSE